MVKIFPNPLIAQGPVGNAFSAFMGQGEAFSTHSPDLYLGCAVSNPLGSSGGGGQAADPVHIVGVEITPPEALPPESIPEVLSRPIPGGVQILLNGKPLCQVLVSVLIGGQELAQGGGVVSDGREGSPVSGTR